MLFQLFKLFFLVLFIYLTGDNAVRRTSLGTPYTKMNNGWKCGQISATVSNLQSNLTSSMAPVYLNQINAICMNIEQRFETLVLEYGYVIKRRKKKAGAIVVVIITFLEV